MKPSVRLWRALVVAVAAVPIAVWSPGLISRACSQDRGGGGRTGAELYQGACAACHGIRGTGAEQSRVGFDLPLPDFTDCSFATREPNADWLAVAHDGGPARAFSKIMPAFGDALSDDELERVLNHIRGFCSEAAWPRGELNLPRPLVTEKAYPEDEAVITSAIATESPSSISNKLIYEKRFGARNQFEVIVPFGWKDNGGTGLPPGDSGDWTGGIGDIAVGAKRALFHSLKHGSIFSVAGELALPTGDRDKGFGKGTALFEPFVAYGQLLPAGFFLHSQAGAELPFDTDRAAQEAFWRAALGRSFEPQRFGRAWTPMLEILGARELVAGEKSQWDLVPQMQVTLSRRQHIMLALGARVPLTESGPRKTGLMFYLLWDWFDGGLFDGW